MLAYKECLRLANALGLVVTESKLRYLIKHGSNLLFTVATVDALGIFLRGFDAGRQHTSRKNITLQVRIENLERVTSQINADANK